MSKVSSNSSLLSSLIADMAGGPDAFWSYTQTLLGSSFDAVIMADGEGLLQCWNENAARLFGYENDDLKNIVLADLVPERYRRRHISAVLAMNHPDHQNFSGQEIALGTACVWGLRKDGSEFPVNIHIGSYRTKSGATHHVAFLQLAGVR